MKRWIVVALALGALSCSSNVRYSPWEIDHYPPGVQESIRKGEVSMGMSPLEVRYAWGAPNSVRIAEAEPDGRYRETWVYTKLRVFVTRLTFTDGKLTDMESGVEMKGSDAQKQGGAPAAAEEGEVEEEEIEAPAPGVGP